MPKKYPSEVRDRAVRMVLDRLADYPSPGPRVRTSPRSSMSDPRPCGSGSPKPRPTPASALARRLPSWRRSSA